MVEEFKYKDRERPEDSFLVKPTENTLKEIQPLIDGKLRSSIISSIDFAVFSSFSAMYDLDVHALKPGMHIAYSMRSPVLNSIRNFGADEKWFEFFDNLYTLSREQKFGMLADINTKAVRDSLDSIADEVGIDSEITVNHSPFMLKWALRRSLNGFTVVAFDFEKSPDDRKYWVWESDLNTQRDEDLIKEMVESVDDRVIENVYAPVYSTP